MDIDKQRKLLLIAIALCVTFAVCFFEFFYLLFTYTAWAVIPFGVGVGSLAGVVVITTLEKGK